MTMEWWPRVPALEAGELTALRLSGRAAHFTGAVVDLDDATGS